MNTARKYGTAKLSSLNIAMVTNITIKGNKNIIQEILNCRIDKKDPDKTLIVSAQKSQPVVVRFIHDTSSANASIQYGSIRWCGLTPSTSLRRTFITLKTP